MELKRIIALIIFFFYSSSVFGDFVLPSKTLKPQDVLKIQLEALKNNDIPRNDFGIEQTWIFAHPNNKKVTGPFPKFRIMLYSESYRILIGHFSHEFKLITSFPNKYVYGVKIMTPEKKLFLYEWHLEKGKEKNCNECWFTSVVSNPIDQGNSI